MAVLVTERVIKRLPTSVDDVIQSFKERFPEDRTNGEATITYLEAESASLSGARLLFSFQIPLCHQAELESWLRDRSASQVS